MVVGSDCRSLQQFRIIQQSGLYPPRMHIDDYLINMHSLVQAENTGVKEKKADSASLQLSDRCSYIFH